LVAVPAPEPEAASTPAPTPAPAPEPQPQAAFWEDVTLHSDAFYMEEEDVSTMLWSPTPYGVRQQKI